MDFTFLTNNPQLVKTRFDIAIDIKSLIKTFLIVLELKIEAPATDFKGEGRLH